MIIIITSWYIRWVDSCGSVLINFSTLLDLLLVAVMLSLMPLLRLDHTNRKARRDSVVLGNTNGYPRYKNSDFILQLVSYC